MANLNALKTVKSLQRRASLITYGLCLAVVSAWTLLRFFNRPSTYDLVTQQVVARSWLHGNFSPVDFGATHYLLKLFILYMPVDLLPGSPRLKLILLTLAVNILTFVLLFKVLGMILDELGIRKKQYLNGAMLWLALIAGSVFWIQFANSRNLEVVGGMFLLYLGLRFLRLLTKRLATSLALFSAVLFFSDTLQVYMTALPLLVYAGVLLTKKLPWRRYVTLVGLLAVGFVLSKVLFWLATHLLHITFTSSSSFAIHYSVGQLAQAVPHSLKAMLILFSGDADVSRLREVVNLLFLAAGAAAFLAGSIKRLIPRRLSLLVAIFFVFDWAVYVVSGQALVADTGRYLIMLAPIAVLALVSLRRVVSNTKLVNTAFVLLAAFNIVTLGNALAKNWDTSFPKDAHIESIARYVNQHNSKLVYASMDSALPLSYYHNAPQTDFVALACAAPRLVAAHSIPATRQPITKDGQVLLILDHSAITNSPNVCTKDMIVSQLGTPIAVSETDDKSQVLVYPASTLTSF